MVSIKKEENHGGLRAGTAKPSEARGCTQTSTSIAAQTLKLEFATHNMDLGRLILLSFSFLLHQMGIKITIIMTKFAPRIGWALIETK
jgi:hypothetical protein